MASPAASIRLALSSRADNMAVVRATISGAADAFSFDEELTSDVKTAASEACNNASIHAYPEAGVGPLWVRIDCAATSVEVTVTDHGTGIRRISGDQHHMGLGLAVINALSSRAQFLRPAAGGTEVRMSFDAEIASMADPDNAVVAPEDGPPDVFGEPDGHVVVWCSAPSLQRVVLERVLWYMAAAAHFSLDGIDAVRDVTSALEDRVRPGAGHGWAGACIDSSTRALELTVGPLVGAGPDAALARHVDALEVRRLQGRELLHFRILDRVPPED